MGIHVKIILVEAGKPKSYYLEELFPLAKQLPGGRQGTPNQALDLQTQLVSLS